MWRRSLIVSTLALALAGASLHGRPAQAPAQPQAPPPSKGVVLKGKAPVSDGVLGVRLPRPQQADLSNGLRLIVLEDRRVPRITLELIVPGAGGYYDPAGQPGVATVVAAMLREGTASRSSSKISEELETMAASLNVFAGMSATDATISGSCLTEHADRLFELLADVVLNPVFPEDELERYKLRTRAGLIQQRTNPGFLGAEMFAKVMYGNHPAGRISMTAEGLDAVGRATLREFHAARYAPDHAALAIAGDISLAEARKLVEGRLRDWKRAGIPEPRVEEPGTPGPPRVSLVTRPNSVQTSLIVGTPAIDRTHPDYDVLQVMNKVIGGGPTGRLFIHLREEKGYTYGAYSGLMAGRWRGAWQASTDVRTEVTRDALRDLLAEITRLREEPVPEREFQDQKRSMIGGFALSLENPQQMLGYYVTSWRFRLPADYWDRFPERVNGVTRAQVQAAARKYLDPGRLQIVAVGEPGRIAEVMKEFGPLETYDTDGKRATAAAVR